MLATLVALLACAIYIAISLVVGDRFPFSRYSMYARLTTRREGAVLYVRVGDRFVAPDDVDAVHGISVDAIAPRGFPTSQEWVSHEAQRWLRSRAADSPPADGEPIEIGYRMMRVDERGQLHERLQPVTKGTARMRR